IRCNIGLLCAGQILGWRALVRIIIPSTSATPIATATATGHAKFGPRWCGDRRHIIGIKGGGVIVMIANTAIKRLLRCGIVLLAIAAATAIATTSAITTAFARRITGVFFGRYRRIIIFRYAGCKTILVIICITAGLVAHIDGFARCRCNHTARTTMTF